MSDNSNDELLAKIAHELKTPLNAIMGFADLLNDTDTLDEDAKYYTKQIIKSGEMLESLIDNLLNLPKLNTEKFLSENIVLNSLIKQVIDSFTPKYKKRRINVKFNENNSHCIVKFDRNKLLQIFEILIDNAIKYNKMCGLITINCNFDNVSKKVSISIKDSGFGIDENRKRIMFRPNSNLSLVKKYLENFDATIKYESIKNCFTKFTITLNAQELINTSDDIYIKGFISDTKLDILYIEDINLNISFVESIIKKINNNIQFDYAYEGKKGLEKLKKNKTNILLLDLGLPDISGLELYNKAKDLGFLKDTITIIITAEARIQMLNKLKDLGVDYIFTKPLDVRQFKKIIIDEYNKLADNSETCNIDN